MTDSLTERAGSPGQTFREQRLALVRLAYPPDGVIVAGTADGERCWMVEAFHRDNCGDPMPGVELLREDTNIVGQESVPIG